MGKSRVAETSNINYAASRPTPKRILEAEDKDNILQGEIKTSAMKKNLAGVFSNPITAERELYGVLLRSVKKRSGAAINVKMNSRTLSMYDTNGAGVPWEKFYADMRAVEDRETLIAYTGLSKLLRFETYSKKTGEAYCFTFRNGNSPVRIDAPRLPGFGTRMTMQLHDNIDKWRLAAGLANCARFSGIPTYLYLGSRLDGGRSDDWMQQRILDSAYVEDYGPTVFGKYKSLLGRSSPAERIRHGTYNGGFRKVEISTKKYRLVGHYWIDSKHANRIGRRETYLNGLPIQNGMKVHLYDWCLSIRDDASRIATTDRDRLTDVAEEELATDINTKLEVEFAGLNISDIPTWRKSKIAKMYLASFADLRHRQLDLESYDLLHFLEQRISDGTAPSKLSKIARKGTLVCMNGVDKHSWQQVRGMFPKNAVLFAFEDENAYENMEPEQAKRYDLVYARNVLDGMK